MYREQSHTIEKDKRLKAKKITKITACNKK